MAPGPNDRHIQTICLMLLTTIAVGAALDWLEPVVVPFVLALFLALALDPLVQFQTRHLRLPRPLAVTATLLLGGLVFLLIGGTLSAAVAQFAADAGRYQAGVEEMVDRILSALPLGAFGLHPGREIDFRALLPVGTTQAALVKISGSVIGILSNTTLVLLFLVFLMAGEACVPRSGLASEIANRVKRYVGAKIAVSAATGLAVYLILAVLGIDYARSFGAFAFLLNFIPNVGSIVSSLLPVPVVLLTPDTPVTTMILAVALPAGVQFLIGNVVEPRLMGGSLDLHPITILLALIFWGMVWGIAGMFLAVPITAVVKIVLERFEVTAPVAALLAGRATP